MDVEQLRRGACTPATIWKLTSKLSLRQRESYLVWVELLKNLEHLAVDIVSEVRCIQEEIRSLIEKHIDEILAFGNDLTNYVLQEHSDIMKISHEIASFPTAGIDSSRTGTISVGHIYFAAVSSAAIIYPQGRSGDIDERIYAKPLRIPDYADPSYVDVELNLNMFKEEVKALSTAVENLLKFCKRSKAHPVIFLDGPIVDPPNFVSIAKHIGKEFLDEYLRYVEERAGYLRDVLEAGGLVIGIIKRIRGSMFVDFIASKFNASELKKTRIGDHSFTIYVSELLREYLDKDKDYVIAFKPFKLPSNVTDIDLYRRQGVDVYSFYLVPRLRGAGHESIPIRVEVAMNVNFSDKDLSECLRKVVAAILAWLTPGINVPEPVLVAHYRCSIRRSEAKKLLKEFASRALYRASLKFDPMAAFRILRGLEGYAYA